MDQRPSTRSKERRDGVADHVGQKPIRLHWMPRRHGLPEVIPELLLRGPDVIARNFSKNGTAQGKVPLDAIPHHFSALFSGFGNTVPSLTCTRDCQRHYQDAKSTEQSGRSGIGKIGPQLRYGGPSTAKAASYGDQWNVQCRRNILIGPTSSENFPANW